MEEKSRAQVSKPIFCQQVYIDSYSTNEKNTVIHGKKIMNKLKAHRTTDVGHVGLDQCDDKILEQTENMITHK